MKTYFGRARLKRHQKAKKGFHLTRLRTSHPSLVVGGVDVLCSCVVVPEHELRKDCWVIAAGSLVVPKLREAWAQGPDVTTEKMLRHVADEVKDVNATAPSRPMEIVGSNTELEQAIGSNKIAVIHTIEGGHALAENPDNVAKFKTLGVAMITIAHFYENGVAAPVDAVPPDFTLKKLGCFRGKKDLSKGLLKHGPDVVEEMFDRGVIVDLTHCTPAARTDVYHLPNPKKRPLVFSHVGAASVRESPKNPTDDEIATIAATGGVVGVIFYNHWLTTADVKKQDADTLAFAMQNIRRIVEKGGEDCVAFGSDFDGLTDPPDDLKEPADLPNLTAALLAERYTPEQIKKFLGGNFKRVLREGWT